MPYLYCTLYCGFQNFSTSSLVGGSMMVILFPYSLSKSFDFLFVKSLFRWYCPCFHWYLDCLLLRAHRFYLSGSSEVEVRSSLIRYFVFIKVVFFFIFGEGLGSSICDILLISGRRLFIRWFSLNVQSPFLLLMFCFLMIHSFSARSILITVFTAA